MKDEELLNADVSNWPLHDPLLTELGRVSALWSALEAALFLALGKLSGFNDPNNPVPFILVTHASFPQRLDMLGSLCEQLSPQHPNLVGYEATIGALRQAQRSRNRFMHNGITLNPSTGKTELALGSARGKVKVALEPVELVDIRRAAAEVHDATRSLAKLVFGTDIPSKFGTK